MTELLHRFRCAGVLSASDVHLARALSRLAEVHQPDVALAVALAARATRHGHVALDLGSASRIVIGELDDRAERGVDGADAAELPWPSPDTWARHVAASPLVASVGGPGEVPLPDRPLVLSGGLLYLQRYWAYERVVAEQLRRRATAAMSTASSSMPPSITVASVLLTGDGAEAQLAAVESALHRSLTVLIGGPGTGKTTTVAALLAVLIEAGGTDRAGGRGDSRGSGLEVALAAPTGKAAARLGEAFRAAADRLPGHLGEQLAGVEASTIHRLLGPRRASRDGFVHHRRHPLHHDVVIVDESSMISLPLMARLLDAVRPDARLVVVGDPGQLTSVDTGSVLADIVGPCGSSASPPGPGPDAAGPGASPLAQSIIMLRHSRRFPSGSPLDRLAGAINAGDATGALQILTDPAGADAAAGALAFIPHAGDHTATIEQLRSIVLPPISDIVDRAAAGDAPGALAALERVRVLCAHRHGAMGVESWNRRIEEWLERSGRSVRGWYPGRPVMATVNDYRLDLYNGDLGVVVAGERPAVAFPASGSPRLIAPSRIDSAEAAHAMTIHKSQGSEFDHVVVVLPSADSRLATRELLYTAVTRARRMVTVVGSPDSVAAAVERRTVRASGLRGELWPDAPDA